MDGTGIERLVNACKKQTEGIRWDIDGIDNYVDLEERIERDGFPDLLLDVFRYYVTGQSNDFDGGYSTFISYLDEIMEEYK